MAIFIAGGVTDLDALALELDATISVKLSFSNKITSHPVEDRSTITDHVFNENVSLSVTAIATNTTVSPSPVRQDKNLLKNTGEVFDQSRVQRAYDIIKGWYKSRQLISIVTDVEVFNSCVIKSLKVPRSVEWANCVNFEMDFEQIRTTSFRQEQLLVVPKKKNESTPETKEQGKQRNISTSPREFAQIVVNLFTTGEGVDIGADGE